MVLNCLCCGAPFTVVPARAKDPKAGKYCSRKCHATHRHQRLTATAACLRCGATFTYPVSRPGKYCSRACYEAAQQAQTVTKTCVSCGKAFTVSMSTARRYHRCSQECGQAERRKHCKRCGKSFLARPGRPDRSYCSEKCRRPAAMVTCIECGKRHRVSPDIASTRRFCSIACYRRHRGETTLEGAVRASLERLGVLFDQERKIGRYSVDFYLPAARVAVEVDGAYWHPSPARDEQRDRRMFEGHGVRVTRLREREVLDAPDLDSLIARKLYDVSNA